MTIAKINRQRECKECHIDISLRKKTSIYCKECALKRRKISRKKYQKEYAKKHRKVYNKSARDSTERRNEIIKYFIGLYDCKTPKELYDKIKGWEDEEK